MFALIGAFPYKFPFWVLGHTAHFASELYHKVDVVLKPHIPVSTLASKTGVTF